MKHLLTQYAWILGIASGLLLLVLLTGCNQAPFANKPLQESVQNESTEQHSSESSIPNFNGIAHALGCVFAPNSCNKQ